MTWLEDGGDSSVEHAPLGGLDELIERALRDDRLVMHFQPRIRVLDGAVVGYEALMRLRTGDGVLLSPSEFMPRATALGLLEQLESRALVDVCRQAARWSEGGHRLQASINVSVGRVLDADRFGSQVDHVLDETGLSPRQLSLELPASLVDHLTPDTVRGLSVFKKLGVMLCLDDFGTGPAGVELLASIGFGEFKLDRGLMAAVPGDARVCSLLRTYATQARALGLRCVAAGVEEAQQHTFLVGAGIALAQGYYYERPLPAASFEELVKQPAGVAEGRR